MKYIGNIEVKNREYVDVVDCISYAKRNLVEITSLRNEFKL